MSQVEIPYFRAVILQKTRKIRLYLYEEQKRKITSVSVAI